MKERRLKTKLHRLSEKYPDIDIRKKGWAKKVWHWEITPKGEEALKMKFKLVCECGKELKWYEEGINGSEYYECECGRTFNIVRGYV